MTCDDCVFHKVVERGQDLCGRCDDPISAVGACINADLCGACLDKMDRGAVKLLVEQVNGLKAERDRVLVTLAKADEYIEAVKRMMDNLRAVNIIEKEGKASG